MKVEKESTELSVSVTDIKQEKLEPNVVESYINVYDTSIVVCKEEFRKNYLATVDSLRSLEETVDVEVKDALFPVTLKEIVGRCIDKCFSKSSAKSKYLEKINYSFTDRDLSICGTTGLGYSLAQLVRATNHNEENKRAESENTRNLPMGIALDANEVHKNRNSHIISKLQEKSRRPPKMLAKKIRPNKIENQQEALSHRATVIQSNIVPTNTSDSDARVEPTKMYVCNHCTFVAMYKSDLADHIRQHINQKSFPSNISDTDHSLAHSGQKLYYCDHCKYSCRGKSSLVHHMKNHFGDKPSSDLCHHKCRHKSNSVSQNTLACNLCSNKCSEKSGFIYNNSTDNGTKSFSFNLCHKKCRQENNLFSPKTHPDEKPFACNLCDCRYRHKSNLYNHKRTHNVEKLYSCNLCKYKCNYKSSIAIHMQTHTDKTFSCELCYYKCKRSITFIRHMKAHVNMKPLPCKVCDFKAPCKSSLTYHMKTHTGKVLFSCNLCHFKCNKRCALVYHMRTHTGERPYVCEVCGFRGSRKCNLNAHMKVHE